MVESISREEIADYAWLAGIIDGEGHLALAKGDQRYYAQIRVSNTDPRLIQRISQVWERQNVKFSMQFLRRPGKRDYLDIVTIGLGSARKVLESVLPYLTAKKDQAECLLSYLTWRSEQGYHGVTTEIRTMGEKIRDELHQLRYQDFNLQRLQRTASKALNLE